MKYVDKVLVCDDGSGDKTSFIARDLGASVISHDRNLGYGAALQSLFKEAKRLGADFVVTLDGDGQHEPNEIPLLLERLMAGDVDIVVGSRFINRGSSEAPKWRENGIKLITGLVSNNGLKLTDAQSGFRAYNRHAMESLNLTEDGMGASTEILIKAEDNGLIVAEVPVNIRYHENSSSENPVLHGFDVLLSTLKFLSMRRPLLFYGLPGFMALCISTIFWVMTLKIFSVTRMISTNIALIALGTTLVGLILMTTAIILWTLISVIREKI
jgi:glycosyltransferase involved in cell wall biosynthesis